MPEPAKKKGVGLLALLGGPGDDDEEDDGEEAATGGAKERAAKDALRAVKSGDASAFSAALERHYEACGMGSEGDDSEEY